MGMDTQFEAAVKALNAHYEIQAKADRNAEQPVWLNFSDSTDSLEDLLKSLDRKELNATFKTLFEKLSELMSWQVVSMEVQNDWLGGIARDYCDVRKGRLHRAFAAAGESAGMTGASGVPLDVILRYVKTIIGEKR